MSKSMGESSNRERKFRIKFCNFCRQMFKQIHTKAQTKINARVYVHLGQCSSQTRMQASRIQDILAVGTAVAE